jgi:hypothetical protein
MNYQLQCGRDLVEGTLDCVEVPDIGVDCAEESAYIRQTLGRVKGSRIGTEEARPHVVVDAYDIMPGLDDA